VNWLRVLNLRFLHRNQWIETPVTGDSVAPIAARPVESTLTGDSTSPIAAPVP
jgi:hypothetical protein